MCLKNACFVLAALCIFVATQNLCALELVDARKQHPLEEFLSSVEDKSAKLTYTEIAALPEKSWNQNGKKSINLGFTSSAWWFRVKLVDGSADGTRWLVKVAYPHLDSIEVYRRDDAAAKLDVKIGGDLYPFSARYISHRHFLFPVNIARAAGSEIFVRVQSESAFNVPISVISEAEQTQQTINEQFAFGIYYGIIIVMILYNLFLYLSARDTNYLLYVLFLIAVGLMNLSLNGFLPQYLTGSMVWLTNTAPPFFTELSIATGIVFSYYFLKIGEAHKILRVAFIAMFSAAVVAAVSHLFTKYMAAILTSNILALIGLPLMIASGVYSLFKGYKPARYYLLSWTLLLLGGALFTLRNFGWVPDGFIARYSMQVGSAAEMILLSLALGDRLRQLKEERERALTDLVEEQERALLKQRAMADAFARFVPQQFLTHLGKEHIEEVRLGDAVERQMAVLFSDIRSFTALSETMSPRENFGFLNSYLRRVGPSVRKHGGFIDKYIGDAVMALFPEKPDDALLTAIDMQRELREFNHHRMKKNFEPVRVGIGLHAGKLYLGTIGEAERMDSTVISDTVNVTSRIEHLTKKLGAAVLISGPLFDQIGDTGRFHHRYLGRMPIRGKAEKIEIHEILDGQSDYILELHANTFGDFRAGVDAFQEKNYAAAASAFDRVLEKNPADKVARLYRERTPK
jgi:class 3 adenylate cyclase